MTNRFNRYENRITEPAENPINSVQIFVNDISSGTQFYTSTAISVEALASILVETEFYVKQSLLNAFVQRLMDIVACSPAW